MLCGNWPNMIRFRQIDVVEIDPLLVEVCRKYFPEIACSLDDRRVHLHNEDGLRFIGVPRANMILSSLILRIRLALRRDCLQRNFTETVIMPCMKTGL